MQHQIHNNPKNVSSLFSVKFYKLDNNIEIHLIQFNRKIYYLDQTELKEYMVQILLSIVFPIPPTIRPHNST